jgi:hypothetical protein
MQTILGSKPDPAAGISSLGGGVSDIFAGLGAESKAEGDLLGQQNYLLAAHYADLEARYTKESTAIQSFQQQREVTKSLGQTTADVAGAGFARPDQPKTSCARLLRKVLWQMRCSSSKGS